MAWPEQAVDIQTGKLINADAAMSWMYLVQVVDSCNHDPEPCNDQHRGFSPTIIVESSLPTAFKMQQLITFASVARMDRWLLPSPAPDPSQLQAPARQLNLRQGAVRTICALSRQWVEAWPPNGEAFVTLCKLVEAMGSLNPALRPDSTLPENKGYKRILI